MRHSYAPAGLAAGLLLSSVLTLAPRINPPNTRRQAAFRSYK